MNIAVQTHDLCKRYVTRQAVLPTLFGALRQTALGPQSSSVDSVPDYALQHISIEVRKGGSLGIIGDNGSGKTTLLKTIAGLYPPSTGSVTVNGVLA